MQRQHPSQVFGVDGLHTLGRWLTDRLAGHASSIAVDDRGVTISYAQLEQRAAQLAEALRAAGYSNGDRIATVTGNGIDQIVLFFACAKAGLVLCPLSWRLTVAELSGLIDHADPALIIYEDEYATLATEAARQASEPRPMTQIGVEGVELSAPSRNKPKSPPRSVRDVDPLLIVFTSGSEAKPKGVVLTHQNCFWNNLALANASNLSSDDTVLNILPQFHIGGWNIFPLLAWWVGATVVLERTFHTSRVLQLIEDRRVSVMMGVPTQYHMLASDPEFDRANLSSLRFAQVGGATVTQELSERWQQRGITLVQGYGLTEAAPNVLYRIPDGKSGGMRPYPHVNVKLGSLTTAVGADSTEDALLRGELLVSGPSVFAGYLENPEATREAMTADGWLRTGDIAERDVHGGLHIVGRIKEIYITGGENVAPAEVERAFYSHSAISEVAVVGAPDPLWGEVGVAFITFTPEALKAQFEDVETVLLKHVRQSLAPYKVPKHVVVLEQLPRISIDKVQRVKLKELAIAVSEGVQVS